MEQEKMELMHEVLTHRYYLGYLAHPSKREVAKRLHELKYFDDERGHATQFTQEYFDEMFEEKKYELIKEVKLLGRNPKTYNQISKILDFPENTLYLHHFLNKLQLKKMIHYRENDDFDSTLKIFIIDLDKE